MADWNKALTVKMQTIAQNIRTIAESRQNTVTNCFLAKS